MSASKPLRTQISMARAAEILGTTEQRAGGRLRALGFGVECHRCERGVYANGLGGTVCWTCNGSGKRIAITEAECAQAKADIEGGALAGYFAQVALAKKGHMYPTPVAEMLVAVFEALAGFVVRAPATTAPAWTVPAPTWIDSLRGECEIATYAKHATAVCALRDFRAEHPTLSARLDRTRPGYHRDYVLVAVGPE